MYCSASSDTSAPCRSSNSTTSGRPPDSRVRVRASSSNTSVRPSAPCVSPAAPAGAGRRAAARIASISPVIGNSAISSSARSERSTGPLAELPASFWRK